MEFVRVRFPAAEGERIAGAAFRGSGPGSTAEVFTWGDRLLGWAIPESGARVLAQPGTGYGEGGCLADVNEDGRSDLVLLETGTTDDAPGTMVWLEAPEWRRHVIDDGALFRDCLATTVNGRRGVLVVHRYTQLRFYQIPANPALKWPYREIHSIYTPSEQGGLRTADVDRDGLEDILCGNYWLRNPGSEEMPWRLFAINLWFETPQSSLLRLVIGGSGHTEWLAAGQREMPEARLAWFERPDDPTTLWREARLEGRLGLRRLRALTMGDFDADGDDDLAAGEDAGRDSRLLIFYNQGGGKFQPVEAAKTDGFVQLWTADLNRDGRPDLVSAGSNSVSWWRNQRRK